MPQIKTKLAGLSLALGLLAVPLGAGAANLAPVTGGSMNHRAQADEVARYAMVDMTELEQIAGRQYLDAETIKFLEDNLWDYQPVAVPAVRDIVRVVLDQETIKFLEDNIWDYGQTAEFAGFDDEATYANRCHGEGLVDPANQAILGVESGSLGAYCSGHASPAGSPNLGAAPTPWLDQIEPMAGIDNPAKTGGVYGIDIGFYSNEIPWQDLGEPVAEFAGPVTKERPVLPFDAPQLRAEEPR